MAGSILQRCMSILSPHSLFQKKKNCLCWGLNPDNFQNILDIVSEGMVPRKETGHPTSLFQNFEDVKAQHSQLQLQYMQHDYLYFLKSQ